MCDIQKQSVSVFLKRSQIFIGALKIFDEVGGIKIYMYAFGRCFGFYSKYFFMRDQLTNYSSKSIFWLSRLCTSNLDRWMEKENKWSMLWKGQQLWASVNDVVSTYQIIRRLNQSPSCRTAELWEKTIMSFRQMFPWANIISTVESERESLVYPSHHPKHTPTWELKQAPHSHNVACPSTYP